MSVDNIWSLRPEEIETLMKSRVVLSMSGGKDSTACALLLEKHNIPFERVFMDTGWEHPILYQYIETVLEPRFGPVTRIKSEKFPNGMVDLVRYKKMFPSRLFRFCTQELKVFPFEEWVKAQDDAVVSVVGIRRQESGARSEAERWAFNESLDIDIFRPLVDHDFDDIIEMHRQGDIPPNPLYLQGAERVGCYPCIFARKSEVDQVARAWPGRIDEIAALEEELTQKAKQRSDNPESVHPRTFFHARNGTGATSIKEVVEWSKTAFGGRQFKLFDMSAQDGCTRWGMCESPLASSELVKIRENNQ